MTSTGDKGGLRDPTLCPPAHLALLSPLAPPGLQLPPPDPAPGHSSPDTALEEAALAWTHGGLDDWGVREDWGRTKSFVMLKVNRDSLPKLLSEILLWFYQLVKSGLTLLGSLK